MVAIPLTPEQRQAIAQAGDIPVRLVDEQSNTTYVLLKADDYEQIRALIEPEDEDRIVEEMYPLLADLSPEDWEDASQYES